MVIVLKYVWFVGKYDCYCIEYVVFVFFGLYFDYLIKGFKLKLSEYI